VNSFVEWCGEAGLGMTRETVEELLEGRNPGSG